MLLINFLYQMHVKFYYILYIHYRGMKIGNNSYIELLIRDLEIYTVTGLPLTTLLHLISLYTQVLR